MSSTIDIVQNIAINLVPVQRLVTGLAYLLGLGFAFKALMTLRQYGESKTAMSSQSSLKEPLIYFLVAAIFIYFPTGMSIMLMTTFGSSNVLEYAPIQSSNNTLNDIFGSASSVAESLILIIRTIGVVAFVRGWLLVARAAGHGQQPGSTGKGLMHILGGILAVNIVSTLEIINNTLYG